MTDQPTPTVWWGPCPLCGAESMHEMGQPQECARCGFRFRIEPWPEAGAERVD